LAGNHKPDEACEIGPGLEADLPQPLRIERQHRCDISARRVSHQRVMLYEAAQILLTPLGQKIEAEKNGDTVLIRGSPVGRGDYDL
jgi:hypothetical protein